MKYLHMIDGMDLLMKDFDELFRPLSRGRIPELSQSYPAMNIHEDNERFLVEIACPGIRKDDIDINANRNMISIEMERRAPEREGVEYSRMERRHGKFKRNITLKSDVDLDRIEAHYEQGILEISIPKAEHMRARRIAVNSPQAAIEQ